MSNAAGWQHYLFFKKESAWGTGVTPDIYLPFATYDVVAQPEFYKADTFTGRRQRMHPNVPSRTNVQGQLVCDLYGYQVTSGSLKSVAQHLIDNAVSGGNSVDQDSFTIEANDPNDPKRHVGVRVNQLTIAGSHDQSAIKATLNVMAKQETGGITPPSLSASTPHYKPFMFADSIFTISGDETELRSFELSVENNLQVYHNNSQWPSIISQGMRVVGLKFTLFKSANTYDALRRAMTVTDTTAQLVLKGRHDGSASQTFTTLTINIDRMNFSAAAEELNINELDQQNVDYVVLKPASSDNDIDLTWGTSA